MNEERRDAYYKLKGYLVSLTSDDQLVRDEALELLGKLRPKLVTVSKCAACGRMLVVRMDGKLRVHRNARTDRTCIGSGADGR